MEMSKSVDQAFPLPKFDSKARREALGKEVMYLCLVNNIKYVGTTLGFIDSKC